LLPTEAIAFGISRFYLRVREQKQGKNPVALAERTVCQVRTAAKAIIATLAMRPSRPGRQLQHMADFLESH